MRKTILVLVIICLMAAFLSKTEGGRDVPNEERGGEVYNPQLLWLGHGGNGGFWPWGGGLTGGLWPWGGGGGHGGGPGGFWPWGGGGGGPGGGPGGFWPWGGSGHGGGPGKFWPWGSGGGPKNLWPWGGGGWGHGGWNGWKKVQDNPQFKDLGEIVGTDNGGSTAPSMENP